LAALHRANVFHPGDGPEPVLLVAVDGLVVAHPAVGGMGIPDVEVRIEQIDDRSPHG